MIGSFPKWRLRLVIASIIMAVSVIAYRIVHIQVIQHDKYEDLAKGQWHEKVMLPAKRGKILDREGRPLAVTYRTYTLGITPKDFPRRKKVVDKFAGTIGCSPSTVSRCLKLKKEYVPLKKDLQLTGEQLEFLSSLPGVAIDPGNRRLRPLEAMDTELLGLVNHKQAGVSGVEAVFDPVLSGEDGWVVFSRDAKNRSFRPLGAPCKKALDGSDLYLTIDSDIQTIVNFELKEAVKRYGASGGVIIVADPSNGDILALSECRGEDEGQSLYSSSCYYEPGSTFKLVTYSYLIDKAGKDPYDAFYGEDGEADFDFGTFRDDHPHGWLTLREAFVYSSNICTIKAVDDTDRGNFYNYIIKFGFGNRTGVDLPVESVGFLREPDEWSGRSLASLAIGQEIGTTPLQMLSAYCALANGGELYAPRLAVKIKRNNGSEKRIEPVRIRRVFSREVSETLMEFCRDVVLKGTGGEAASDLVPVAGKTGTAQKADETGYMRGKYISSFIGFAPAGAPRVVCLVLLDEPSLPYHYGGLSSAPVFKKVIEGICLTTDIISDEPEGILAIGEEADDVKRTPSFYRLKDSEAFQLASETGFRVRFEGEGGFVWAQVPDPGTLVEPGTEITLFFRKIGNKEVKEQVPDLRGLTIRQARRKLIECGFRGSIRGSGIVKKQFPRPGSLLKKGSSVSLLCEMGVEL